MSALYSCSAVTPGVSLRIESNLSAVVEIAFHFQVYDTVGHQATVQRLLPSRLQMYNMWA